MATFLGSPAFLSHPITKTNHHLSSSSQTPPNPSPPNPQPSTPLPQLSTSSTDQPKQKPIFKPSTKVESTDWIGSSLTRRFGLGAGLAWAAFLSFGVISEQPKTRFEVSQQLASTRDIDKEEEVMLPNGIRYIDLRIGGGASPRQGDLVVIDVKGKVEGGEKVFVDTFGGEKKPLALVMGSRPYSKGMCEGIESALRSMKGGGRRKLVVPPNLGFGENGAEFGNGIQIPPLATLEYIVEVEKVSNNSVAVPGCRGGWSKIFENGGAIL